MNTPVLAFTLLCGWLVAGAALADASPEANPHAAHHGVTHVQQAPVQRSISVVLGDEMRFSPAQIEVKQGETIRFELTNQGQLPHEFVLGSAEEINEHATMMAEMPGMQHSDGAAQTVAPGETAQLVWTFKEAGNLEFVCLVAGHLEAGMRGQIKVLAP